MEISGHSGCGIPFKRFAAIEHYALLLECVGMSPLSSQLASPNAYRVCEEKMCRAVLPSRSTGDLRLSEIEGRHM